MQSALIDQLHRTCVGQIVNVVVSKRPVETGIASSSSRITSDLLGKFTNFNLHTPAMQTPLEFKTSQNKLSDIRAESNMLSDALFGSRGCRVSSSGVRKVVHQDGAARSYRYVTRRRGNAGRAAEQAIPKRYFHNLDGWRKLVTLVSRIQS